MIETRKSFCRFCHVFCGIEVDVENDRVVAVRGDPDNAVTQGYTCLKGRAEVERIYHPDRLLSSRKRVNSGWEDIGAEKALDEIADRLRDIVDKHGPGAVAAYGGCGAHRTSAGGPRTMGKFMEALGSEKLYTSFTIDSPSLPVAYFRLFGGIMATNLFDIANADVTMFVGTNPVLSHMPNMPQSNPLKRVRDAQQRGMKVIVIDPRCCDVARGADIHLQLKPGEDATLLAGMTKIIIERKLYDQEYVANYVSGVDELYEAVKDFDLPYVSKRTEVEAPLIEQAAEMFCAAERGGAISGTGLHMARHQNLTTTLVMVLNALCGRYDRRGGFGRNEGPLGFEVPEGMGPVPLPLYPGPVSRIRGIRATISFMGFYTEMPTNTLTDEILTPGDEKIRALIVLGGNPALVLPDEASTVRALEDLDLLVVNDLFLSATAKFAHYVMAVRHPFERADFPQMMDYTYPFAFGQYTPPLVAAPEGVIEDWEVLWGVADRMGLKLDIPGIPVDRKPTTDEMLDGIHATARIPLDEIRQYPGGHVWGEREAKVGGVIPNMIGHEDRKMAAGHPEVIAELRGVRAEPVIDGGGYEIDEKAAFRLITYRMKEVYCTQGHDLPSLRAKRSFNPVLMNPEAMASLGVKDGDRVKLDSGFGEVVGIVEASDDIAPGTVALAFGWGDPSDDRDVREKGCNVQRLIPDDERYDPITGLALFTAIPVNISPCG